MAKKVEKEVVYMSCKACDKCEQDVEHSRAVGYPVCIYGGPYWIERCKCCEHKEV